MMKIYKCIDDFEKLNGAVVTIGTFDGVHHGHRKILKRVNELAASLNSQNVLLTFFPHPRMVLHPDDHGLQLLNTLEEKIMLLEKAGIQHLIIHPFSKEFSRTTSTEFVRDYLVNKIGTKVLVIGYDHHFGRNRQGSLEELKELASVYEFKVEEIPPQEIKDIAVSSTKIRKALIEGDLAQANAFLTYPYLLTGKVSKGHSRGRKLGFPTANLKIEEDYKLIPATGIYITETVIEGSAEKIPALLSVGHNPTFGHNPLSLEVYILDFDKEIYGMTIQVMMIQKLRDEMKFENEEQLITQMKEDEKKARDILRQRSSISA